MSIASLAKSSSAGLPLALDRLSNHNNNNNTQHHNNNNNSKELQIRQHHLPQNSSKTNQVGTVVLYGVPIVSLVIDQTERLCLAQISNTLLKAFSYNEIHNRRVALGITCVQCTPVQLEILRRAGAMPVSSRRCGMITRREAERLCKSFLGDNSPPRLPDDFAFAVHHECAWGCRGSFLPSRYNSSRAKCIKCSVCGLFFSPNKFIFHSHRSGPGARYVQPDAANFNSWRRHMRLSGSPPEEIIHAWEDVKVKAMFNGGTRKRLLTTGGPGLTSRSSSEPQCKTSSPHMVITSSAAPGGGTMTQKAASHHDVMSHHHHHHQGVAPFPLTTPTRVPPLPLVMDYVWHHAGIYPGIKPYCLPWLAPSPLLIPPPAPSAVNMTTNINNNHVSLPEKHAVQQHASAFRPVFTTATPSRCVVDTQLPPPPPLHTTRTPPHNGDVTKSPSAHTPLSSPRSRSEHDDDDDDYIDDDMSNTKAIPEVDGVDRERSSGGGNEVEMRGVEGNEEEEDDEETVDIETCPEDEVKPTPCWTHVTSAFDNEKKYQVLSQGSEPAEKPDEMDCEAERKCLPFPWSEAFLHSRQRQLMIPHSHLIREKLPFQPEVNVNGNDVTLPVDCTTCHQITADIYTGPAIKHQ